LGELSTTCSTHARKDKRKEKRRRVDKKKEKEVYAGIWKGNNNETDYLEDLNVGVIITS
jgi:hypothetical protein